MSVKLGTAIRLAAVVVTGAFLVVLAWVYESNCDSGQGCGSDWAWARGMAVVGAVAGIFALFEARRDGGRAEAARAG